MQYLKSTDTKYDKVLANIFNYIFEKEENKLNLDESTCKFDLTSLQGPVLIFFSEFQLIQQVGLPSVYVIGKIEKLESFVLESLT